ncbi:MAG: class I SAM-dependent methyltransferase [Novosphingobium sp.]
MGIYRKFAEQLARPRGAGGRMLGKVMDLANRKPVRRAIDLLEPQDGQNILDAGCGTGEALAQVLRRAPCTVTGVDPSSTMLAATRSRLGSQAILMNTTIEQASLAPASFDAALALNVLYFCGADGGMLKAIHRALRPGGRFVAYVTHRDTMERWPFVSAGLHRLYTENELRMVLEKNGFAPEGIAVHSAPVTRGVRGIWALAIR